MWAKLPQLFGRLPKAKLEVRPIEEFREKNASGADYQAGTPDGKRPGHVNVAYTEGWALYAERLGREAGFFQDPYSLYGHYTDDLLRAIRLVVDTGFHAKHWTRQQGVDYFHENSGIDEPTVQSETDRYMAWPAQALGYKMGQLEILALREKAQKELGSRFDLRSFHDEVLGGGALPLDVLQERIALWTRAQKVTQ